MEASQIINEPLYDDLEEGEEIGFIAKKLDFKKEELISFINSSPSSHLDYKNASNLFNHNNLFLQIARYFAKGELNRKSLYELHKRFK